MPDRSAADTLRAAADRLQSLADAATPGPWEWRTVRDIDELTHPQEISGWPVHPLNVMKAGHEDWPPGDADKAWTATFSPTVAAPLVEWLRTEADDAAAVDAQNTASQERALRIGGLDVDGQTYVLHRSTLAHALNFAYRILETPDA